MRGKINNMLKMFGVKYSLRISFISFCKWIYHLNQILRSGQNDTIPNCHSEGAE